MTDRRRQTHARPRPWLARPWRARRVRQAVRTAVEQVLRVVLAVLLFGGPVLAPPVPERSIQEEQQHPEHSLAHQVKIQALSSVRTVRLVRSERSAEVPGASADASCRGKPRRPTIHVHPALPRHRLDVLTGAGVRLLC